MLRLITLAVVFSSTLGASTLASQTPDTARVRAAYDAASGLRGDYEKSHGRFVTVNGIKMHYLEWGAARGTPLVWAHGSASTAYEIRPLHRGSPRPAIA